MLNAEKFKKEILENLGTDCLISFNKRNHKIEACTANQCLKCLFNAMRGNKSCYNAMLKWLLSEDKEPVKLTELEHGILEYLLEKRQYRFVVRERNDCLYIYKSKPKKEADSWESLSLNNELGLFNKLFQFVHWEDSEPTSIEDVLGNCEVIENE